MFRNLIWMAWSFVWGG